MLLKQSDFFRGSVYAHMRQAIALAVAFLLFNSSFSQTANISGIVNTYHSVIEIVPAKAAVRLNTTAGLSLSQSVMIVQMKGASINSSNSASFGDTTSLSNAGNYEIGTICGIRGDSIFLFHNLANSYTISGKVQVVGIPSYYSAIVTDTLRAQTWNNVTGTGGVIALNVDQTLTLNKPIFADKSGFNGGDYVLSNGSCSNIGPANAYNYNAAATGPQNGAFKGESIFDITVAAQTGGRAAVANGGGGGNNHNNGGGGGANIGAGGAGGGNSSTAGCTANLRGLGGKALSSWNGKKIFLGGGGGAGHSNANFTPPIGGGNGGGIIFIHATSLISNNEKISANGDIGGNAVSDGASGGGGGGTIIADIQNYSGTLTMRVAGGNGGTENDGGNVGRCYGAGGGGGGGVIYFKNALPASTLLTNGGAAGAEAGRDAASCAAIVAAVAGNAGSTVTNYSYSRSLVTANYCSAIPLPLGLIYFRAIPDSKIKVRLEWKTTETIALKKYEVERSSDQQHWSVVTALVSEAQKNVYRMIDENPAGGNNYYRLRITDNNNKITYSPLQKVYIQSDSERLIIYPNPAKESITIEGRLPMTSRIRLLNSDGKLISQRELFTNQQKVQFNLPSLPAGMYFIQINSTIKKITIQ